MTLKIVIISINVLNTSEDQDVCLIVIYYIDEYEYIVWYDTTILHWK